jgi:hypothetical protein
MKKIRPFYRKCSHPAAALFLLAAILCIFASCEYLSYKRPFADSYYNDNFIASIGFDRFSGTDTLPAPDASSGVVEPVTGSWDFSYRYTEWDGYGYLTLNRISPTGEPAYATAGGSGFTAIAALPSGLDASSPVFRLELVNLVSGGDFEAASDDPAASGLWTYDGTRSSAVLQDPGQINGKSVVVSQAGNAPLEYLLNPVAGQLVAGAEYYLDFRWVSTSIPDGTNNLVKIDDMDSPVSFETADEAAATKSGHAHSAFTALGSGTDGIMLETNTGWDFVMDDLSVKKVGGLELRLLLAPKETSPVLKDLLYRFTVWVHADPSVQATSSPYHLDTISVRMLPTAASSLSSRSYGSYDWSASSPGWQKLTVEIDNGNLMFTDGTASAVLELVIDFDDALPGRVLLAQPELRAYPDGY